MVLLARCKEMLNNVTQVKDGEIIRKTIQWTNISKKVAMSFLKYLYSGVLELDLESYSFEEWEEARSIGQIYEMELWNYLIESLRDDFDQTQ